MVPEIKALHLELTNMCTLKCPACPRTEFINGPFGKHWRNHNLDYYALDQFLDIDLTGVEFYLCGNYGDPLYYTDLFDFVKHFKARGVSMCINTNGSHKSEEWWNNLCSLLNPITDRFIFAIDGTPDNFTQYRINANWSSIEIGIESCVKHGFDVEWQYLVFNYNEKSIDEAKEIAEQMGVSKFIVKSSSRFHADQQYLMPSEPYVDPKYFTQQEVFKDKVGLDPLCKTGQDHFVTADGFFTPCCYTATHYFYYKNVFGKERKSLYSIDKHTMTEMLAYPQTVEFYNHLDDMLVCQFNCPSRNT